MAFTKITNLATTTIKAGWQAFNTLIDDLLSTTSGLGASCIGIEDSAGYFTAVNVEAGLAEEHAANVSAVALGNVFNEKASTTTGLTWGYEAGTIRFDNTITTVATGTIALTDDATNYVEIQSDGTVSRNTTSFTAGRIPIRQIVCASGVQTTSTDRRSWFTSQVVPLPVNKGGSGQTTYTNGQILIGNTTGNTQTKATITGTANQITITNAAGSITISIPDTAGITFSNEGLHILDTNASHDLIIKAGSDLTADRILTITTGDAARTITLATDLTVSTYGASLIDDANAGAAQTTLGISAFVKTVLDDADAATLRTTIGCPSDPAAGTAGLRTLSTTATTACAGDDARLSDARTPTAHSHGLDTIENGSVMLPLYDLSVGTEYSQDGNTYIVKLTAFRVYIPPSAVSIKMTTRQKSSSADYTAYVKFMIGANSSTDSTTISTAYVWLTEATLDVSALSGWYDMSIWLRGTDVGISYLQGFSFVWE